MDENTPIRVHSAPDYHGSCLCSAIRFRIQAQPVKASHCYCTMCQKGHGAAFASYARFRRSQVQYLCGEDKLKTYVSSGDVHRKFCSDCGSNIEWGCAERFPEWVAIALGVFDTPFEAGEALVDLHRESKAGWCPPVSF